LSGFEWFELSANLLCNNFNFRGELFTVQVRKKKHYAETQVHFKPSDQTQPTTDFGQVLTEI
jgi:hypothetical protein